MANISFRGAIGRLKDSPVKVNFPDGNEILVSAPTLGALAGFTEHFDSSMIQGLDKRDSIGFANLFAGRCTESLTKAVCSVVQNCDEPLSEQILLSLRDLNQLQMRELLSLIKSQAQSQVTIDYYALDKIKNEPTEGAPKKKRKGLIKTNYWEIVGNAMKYWRISYVEALWGMSYHNLVLLNMSIPKFDKDGNRLYPPTEINGDDLRKLFKTRRRKQNPK